MMVLEVRMNNEQDGTGLRFNPSRAERMPAFVLEDQRRQ
jgi:hypothetical protein